MTLEHTVDFIILCLLLMGVLGVVMDIWKGK